MERTLEYLLSVIEGDEHDYAPTAAERQLAEELIALEDEEAEVSALRRRLHDRLGGFPNPVTEERAREVSTYRRELHERIDLVRGQLAALGWERTTNSPGRTGRAT